MNEHISRVNAGRPLSVDDSEINSSDGCSEAHSHKFMHFYDGTGTGSDFSPAAFLHVASNAFMFSHCVMMTYSSYHG